MGVQVYCHPSASCLDDEERFALMVEASKRFLLMSDAFDKVAKMAGFSSSYCRAGLCDPEGLLCDCSSFVEPDSPRSFVRVSPAFDGPGPLEVEVAL